MAITGAIKGSSRECLYRELGLESLRDRRWYRRLVSFYNINSGNSPDYLKSLIPENQYSYFIMRQEVFYLKILGQDPIILKIPFFRTV